jgi:hypothetical protein
MCVDLVRFMQILQELRGRKIIALDEVQMVAIQHRFRRIQRIANTGRIGMCYSPLYLLYQLGYNEGIDIPCIHDMNELMRKTSSRRYNSGSSGWNYTNAERKLSQLFDSLNAANPASGVNWKIYPTELRGNIRYKEATTI